MILKKYQAGNKLYYPTQDNTYNPVPQRDFTRLGQNFNQPTISVPSVAQEHERTAEASRQEWRENHPIQTGISEAFQSVALAPQMILDPELLPGVNHTYFGEQMESNSPQKIIQSGAEVAIADAIGGSAASKFIPKATSPMYTPVPSNALSKTELYRLRQELAENGIVKQQKTYNLPWKEPIRKGIEPWGYVEPGGIRITDTKFGDILGSVFGGKNPLYISEEAWKEQAGIRNLTQKRLQKLPLQGVQDASERPIYAREKSLKKVINLRDENRLSGPQGNSVAGVNPYRDNPLTMKNRYATWNMYLGKPQTQHPLYDVSEASTKDNIVYTIKPEFSNMPWINGRIGEIVDKIEGASADKFPRLLRDKVTVRKSGDSFIVPDHDGAYWGTKGGFHWKVDKLPDNTYKAVAKDVWDLQPYRYSKKLPKFIRNSDIGALLGIGKPLDVQTGYIFDPSTRKIIKNFGAVPPAIGATTATLNRE